MGTFTTSYVKMGASAIVSSHPVPYRLSAALLSTENTSLSMSVASLLMTCGLYISSEDWNPVSRLMVAGGLFSGLFLCWKKEEQCRLRSSLVWISRITVILLLFCHGMGWQHCPCVSTCTSGVQCQGGVLQALFWLFTSASCYQVIYAFVMLVHRQIPEIFPCPPALRYLTILVYQCPGAATL